MDRKRSLIPGPAGRIQAEERAREKLAKSMLDNPGISGALHNSYERRVRMVNCVVEAEDPSFVDLPWKTTIDFLTQQGNREWTLLKELQHISPQWRRIPFVVAVIHKLEPNGLGDAMVVLKDPTSTIQASIHNSAMSNNKYGPHIKEGSVLLLKEVVVVKFLRTTTYLNIVLKNISNVICKENLSTAFNDESGPSRLVTRNQENWLYPEEVPDSDEE